MTTPDVKATTMPDKISVDSPEDTAKANPEANLDNYKEL
jgi:hypothetical protein